MTFFISLCLAVLFVLSLGGFLRKKPAVFYMVSAAVAAVTAGLTWLGIPLPASFSRWVWPVLARGGLAGAFFVIVMVTGAFPNGSAPMKRLAPVRGQLSIIASILTLGHNAAYGKTYFVRLFTNPEELPLNQLLAALCSIAMLIIMLPLFITSFLTVRRHMNPKSWKKLQRPAYVFYGLLYCHILLLTVPGALKGDRGYLLTVFVYSAVFLGYGVCRILKALSGRKSGHLAKRQMICSAVCCAAALTLCAVLSNPAVVEAEEILPETGTWRDGVFTGSAMGMNAPVAVSVTVQEGKIIEIVIDSSRDDEPYFTDALTVIDEIISGNSVDIDTVSGATYSSGGIIDAVTKALAQAQITGGEAGE